MSMTQYAIKNNRVTIVVLILIIFAGYSAFMNLPKAEDPGFVIRTALVMTRFPGASPQRMEELVTDKLEKSIQEMPELDYLRSTSKTGISMIYVNIKASYTKLRPIWDSLRRKVEQAELPDGVIGPFVNDEFGDVYGTIITIIGEGFSYREIKDVADEVRDELLLIGDVAKVDILGEQDERIFVEYNNARLAEFGLSPYQMQQILETRNIIIPGGNISTDYERLTLEPSGNFESLEDLKRTVIQIPGSSELLFLQDIAEIRRGYIDPPGSRVFSSGVPALGLAISMRDDGDIVAMGDEVKQVVTRLQGMYPIGIEFDFIAAQSEAVAQKVKDFVINLVQAVVIVILAMILALGFRTGFIVAALIPMAMAMSLAFMMIFDIGMDQVSLASLIIALGMLVDNAIVMSESIMVQMAAGKKAVQAAIDSAKELQTSLLTSSLTTSAAFLPIFLAESNMGEYAGALFKVITITLLCSWFLALTMTPTLCVGFLKVKPKPAGSEGTAYDSRFYRSYRNGLLAVLRRPFMTLIATVIVFLIAMQGFRIIPSIFMPPNDKAIASATLTFPVGTPIERTTKMAELVDAYLAREFQINAERPEGIVNWGTFIGESAPRFLLSFNTKSNVPEYAMFLINTNSREMLEAQIMPGIETFFNEHFPDAIPSVGLLQNGPAVDSAIAIRLSGRELGELYDIVDVVKQKLAATPGVKNTRDNWGIRTKKIVVNVNQTRARLAGVSSQDIAISLQTLLSGLQVSEYRESDTVIPIMMRSQTTDREDIDRLENQSVYAQTTGKTVPLKQVADIEVVWEPAKILRRQRLKTIKVSTDVATGVSALQLSKELDIWLADISKNWKLGYRFAQGGEQEKSKESTDSIMKKIPVAGFLILLLMIMQFNSFRKPLIIALTIPLGMIGVVVGLLITGATFGFMTLLGVVSLAGIVINNAIVLLDRIRVEMVENGRDPQTAVLEAAQRRLRPILLTTATTVAGLIPLWFGGGAMWESMAIAIIFGLLLATCLTLGIVPVLYSLLFRVKFKDYTYRSSYK